MNISLSNPVRKLKKGQSLLEFALVFPVFIAVVLFLIDILRFYFLQQTLSFQVRQGLRAGVVYDPSNPPEVTSGTPPVTTQLSRRAVVYQAVDDSNLFHFRISYTDGESVSNPDVIATLSPGDDPSTTAVEDAGAANEQITLEMSYQHFTFLTPFLGVLFESQPTGYIPLIVSQSFQNEDQ